MEPAPRGRGRGGGGSRTGRQRSRGRPRDDDSSEARTKGRRGDDSSPSSSSSSHAADSTTTWVNQEEREPPARSKKSRKKKRGSGAAASGGTGGGGSGGSGGAGEGGRSRPPKAELTPEEAAKRAQERKAALKAKREAKKKREEEAARAAKLKAEEDARRAEEEARLAAEEAERLRILREQKEKEEAERARAEAIKAHEEALTLAHTRVEEYVKAREEKRELRNKNLCAGQSRPPPSHFKKLDSSIRKNTSFIKRVKQGITADGNRTLVRDLKTINLSRYVTEVAGAVSESKIKTADIPAAVHFCSEMHARYADFAEDVVSRLARTFDGGIAMDAPDQEKKDWYLRQRTVLRLLTEMVVCGLHSDFSLLAGIVKQLVDGPHLRDGDGNYFNLLLMLSFVRQGVVDLLGLADPSVVALRKLLKVKFDDDVAGEADDETNDDPAADGATATVPSGDANGEATAAVGQKESGENGQHEDQKVVDAAGKHDAGGATDEKETQEEDITEGEVKENGEEEEKAEAEGGDETEEAEEDEFQVDDGEPLIDPSVQKQFHHAVLRYFRRICDELVGLHKAIRKRERKNHEVLMSRGELHEDRAAAYEKAKKCYDKVLTNVSTLAELLCEEMVELPEEPPPVTASSESKLMAQNLVSEDCGVFDDPDTKSFYENLLDIRAAVPGVLLGGDSSGGDASSGAADGEGKDDADRQEKPGGEDGEEATTSPPEKSSEAGAGSSERGATSAASGSSGERPSDEASASTSESAGAKDGDDASASSAVSASSGKVPSRLDLFLAGLPSCVNRDMIDKAAVEFCYLNGKGARKRLVKALFHAPRNELVLLPYYGRLAATLSQCMPDIGSGLVMLLEDEFRMLFRQKDQIKIESKIRNARYIGELIKFRLCSVGVAFACLKKCLDNFAHHNIDVACALLETCGRYLYRTPETRVRTNNILGAIMKLKSAKTLEMRQEALIENAYYHCKPPDGPGRLVKPKDPVKEYIKFLLSKHLAKNTAKEVVKRLRCIPWETHELYLLKRFLKMDHVTFSKVHLLATVIGGLSHFYDVIGIKTIDYLLESIRCGLMTNVPKHNQRRLCQMKLLGEMYNHCVGMNRRSLPYSLSDSVLFEVLYEVIMLGVGTAVDPQKDCFRVRLVCMLLSTSAQHFDRGAAKHKLDAFLLYFQRYLLAKSFIPLDVEFMVADLFDEIRPGCARIQTLKEACEAVIQLELTEKRHTIPFNPEQLAIKPPEEKEEQNGDANSADEGTEAGQVGAGGDEWESEEEEDVVDDDDDDEDDDDDDDDDEDEEDEEEKGEAGIEESGEGDEDADEDADEEAAAAQRSERESEWDNFTLIHGSMHLRNQSSVRGADEDSEFEAMFGAMMQESMEGRARPELRTKPIKVSLPKTASGVLGSGAALEFVEESVVETPVADEEGADGADAAPSVTHSVVVAPAQRESATAVQFKLLTKKGGKAEPRMLNVPIDCTLAVRQIENKKQREQERRDLKKFVMSYEESDDQATAGTQQGPPHSYHPPQHHQGQRTRGQWGNSGHRGYNKAPSILTPTQTPLKRSASATGPVGNKCETHEKGEKEENKVRKGIRFQGCDYMSLWRGIVNYCPVWLLVGGW